MDNKAHKPNIKLPRPKADGKLSVVGRFLKDVFRFVFDEDESGEKIKRDLLSVEQQRAEERLAAKALEAKAAAEAKTKQAAAKAAAEAEARKKFAAAKQKTAEQFKQEREAMLKRKQLMAEHLLKEKHLRAKSAKRGFWSRFKQHAAPQTAGAGDSSLLMLGGAAQNLAAGLPPVAPRAADKTDRERAAGKFQSERLRHESANQREQVENRPWQSYNIVATNLIREQRSMFLNWQGKILLLMLFVSLAVLACILTYGFLLVWEKDKLNSNDYVFKNLASIATQIKQEENQAQEILNFNDKLTAVAYLLNNHIYWTQFFKFLEDNTINEVYFQSFSGDTSGKYNLPAVAKDFRSVSNELKVLQNNTDQVLSVSSGGAETAGAGQTAAGAATSTVNVKFNLDLNLNRSVFIKLPDYE